MRTARKIASHYLFDNGRLLPHPVVSVAEDGTVTEVERCENPDRMAGTEFYAGILVPGLVNSHCHLELSCMGGAIAPGGGFIGFARGMGERRSDFTPQERAAAISAADAAMWRQGVSAVADVCNGGATFDTKRGSGIFYHSFLELFGLGAQAGLQTALSDTARQASETGLRFSATPHSTYSLEDGAFREAVEGFSRYGIEGEYPLLSVHFMESPQERELFEGRGGMREWYAGRGQAPGFVGRYASPAERLTSLVPPERDIMLIHNCCVTEEDYDRISAHFTGQVTWVICPGSNRYITGLEPPVALLRRKGARIAVGTDSLASNLALDMLGELKAIPGVPLEELLQWATRNGAAALGKEAGPGSFAPGTKPGGAIITGIDWRTMSLTSDAKSERVF